MFISALGHCLNGIGAAGAFSSVALPLFLAGLLGGFAHCSLMCGPFVLMQMARGLEAVPAQKMRESHRFYAALLIPYHLGRMTTYAALGAAMAFFIGGIALWWRTVSGVILGISGLLMIASILYPSVKNIPLPAVFLRIHARLLRIVSTGEEKESSRRPFAQIAKGYRLGLVLGLLPCGMVYAALLAAAGTASPWQGALSMVVFTLGTIPGLVFTALAGSFAMTRLRIRAGSWARAGSVVAGLWLCIVSVSLLLT